MHVRFLANFIITTVETSIDASGQLVAQEHNVHIEFGRFYPITNYEVHGNSVTIYFADNSPIKGIAPHVERGYCEFIEKQPVVASTTPGAPRKSGCGGCGKK